MAEPTYVLVHGAGTSSLLWAPVQRELALRGARSYAVDLPGHGFDARYSRHYQAPQDLAAWALEPSRLGTVTLEDNVETVLTAVRRLREHGPVVLVASSLGGVTITGVANQAPDLVDRLVYISAWACVAHDNPYGYMTEPEFADSLLPGLAPLNVGDPEQLGAGRANYRTADPDLLAALREATMAEASEEQFLAFQNIMEPDESTAVMFGDARVRPETWGRVPRTYVRLLADRSLPLAMQDHLIEEGDKLTPENPYRVRSLDSSHAGFVLQPAEVATILMER